MNYSTLRYYLAQILRIEGAFMLPAVGIAIYNRELTDVRAFVITIAILFVLSALLLIRTRHRPPMTPREGIAIVALGWVLLSATGALPFVISKSIPRYVDAFFETASGFTTTGATILSDVEALGRGLLYWRSFTHWLGGMGVLVFLLAIMPKEGGDTLHILRAESPGPQPGKLAPRMRSSMSILYGIYIGLTLLEIALLLLGDMPLFDALVHAFGTAGTGGFSIKNASIAAYDSIYLQNVIAVFMMLFGVNFSIYYLLLMRQFSQAAHNDELRLYLLLMGGSTLAIALNILPLYGDFFKSLHYSFFQVSSIMTTTGFTTVNFNEWPQFSRVLLVLLMIIGASAGSTGGGIKVARFSIILKSIKTAFRRHVHPRSVQSMKLDGRPIAEPVLRGVNEFFAAYFVVCAVSMLLVAINDHSLETTVTSVLACINNIGPGLDLVGATGNYGSLSDMSKIVLSLDMLIGRLEVFPMLLLFSPTLWARRR